MTSTIHSHVDDADELAADWRKAGMEVVDPENQDHGGETRGLRHADPDGNVPSGSADRPRRRIATLPLDRTMAQSKRS